MFCYTLFSFLLWMVIVTFVKTEGASLGTKSKLTGCHFKNDINITEVICPVSYMGCMPDPTSWSDDKIAPPGTEIRYTCINSSPGKESTSTNITTTCKGHRWFPPILQRDVVTTTQKPDSDWSIPTLWRPPAFPFECGKSTIKGDNAKLPVRHRHGNSVKPGEFPWHAGVYESKGEKSRKPICGATIIASQYLLSAAHCFTEITNTAIIRNHTEFYIMVGKLKSRNNLTENSQQRHDITHIITYAYRGRDYRYQNDIAIIRTRSELTFNSNVSPICMINNYFPHIPENAHLWVAGWGFFNVLGEKSENLMSIQVPYTSYDECSGYLSSEVSTFLTTEKFCIAKNENMGMSLDEGDRGSGLVTKGPNNAYYLIGIVSVSREDSTVVMCTYVPHFHKWIIETTSNDYIHPLDKNSPRNGTMATKPRNTVSGQPSQTTKTPPTTGTYPVLPGEFPWHAGVYEKSFNNTLICGATIISSYTLLSAAHCFYDPINDRQRSPVDYEIGVGEITRQTFIAGSETTAFYEVKSLIFNNYQGPRLRYLGDIAIIVTKTKISFNSQVSPISMFQDSNFRLASNELLHVVRWNSQKNVSELVNQPYISFDDCNKITPLYELSYLENDKFCSRTNETASPWTRMYHGGSGLVRKNPADFAYYLVGIELWKVNESSIVLNTDVSTYLSWIHEELNQIHKAKNVTFSG